jgi:predicted GNAT superfamily acetyltransferase
MVVEIRPIQTHEEYQAVEHLQREVWGFDDVQIVPIHLLLTAHKNGGLVLGAFDAASEGESQRLVAFVFGFVGLSPDGRTKHCSHMLGVDAAFRDRNLGYRLKLAQREHVLRQGIDLITWTFDPRNANLNFRKLGATCNTYVRDLYGDMSNLLYVGLSSDRLQVDWHIASDHVAARLRRKGMSSSLSALRAEGVPVLNRPLRGDLPRPAQTTLPLEGERLLVQIPSHLQAIKAADMGLARAWRLHARSVFESAFTHGYVVTDLLFEDGQSCYFLERNWTPR